jgi:hypothetical protein
LFYPLRGKELNFNMLSLLPFFRLLFVNFYAHVSVQSGVNGGCELCGKKDFPDEECMFFQNNNLSEKGLKQNLDLGLNINRGAPPPHPRLLAGAVTGSIQNRASPSRWIVNTKKPKNTTFSSGGNFH